MNKTLAVAKWEYIEKVKTKAFLIGLFLTPLIMSIFIVVPGLLSKEEKDQTKKIGIIDETHVLTSFLSERLIEKYKLPSRLPTYRLIPLSEGDLGTDQLKILGSAEIASGELDGYLVVPSNVIDSGKVEYRAENAGNVRDQERFARVFEDIILERRAKAVGYDPAVIRKISANVEIKTFKVSKQGEEKESGFMETFFTGYIFILLLMFLVMSSGQMLIRSVIEEKSNRIIEVLVSSCSSKELMSGKVIGLSLLGLTTIAFWALLLIAVNFASPIPYAGVEHVALLALYFVLGYFMYVAIFIMAGSTVSTEQEAQQMTGYITIFLVLPITLAVPVMLNPDSLLVKILSQIPLFTPTMMALRFSIQTPAWWEIILSLCTLSLTIWGLMWMAAKVFRIGILITGKRPNLKEIFGWLRTEK
ncbi:MAG: ABC transporter permease [Bacteroidota bacterium]|nr:ABC transporter permease [Bacteroidota bacterium]